MVQIQAFFAQIGALFVNLFDRPDWRNIVDIGILAVLIYSYVRIFSRNIPKRAAENRWYLAKQAAVSQRFSSMKTRWRMRQTYRYFRCPHCRQELRVPRGRGRISITCPKCGTSFIKKS